MSEEAQMLTLRVPGMTCTHCKQRIEGAIRAVDPAAGVSVDLAARVVRVDSVAADETLRSAITNAGYPPA